jgi:hypothetical protein
MSGCRCGLGFDGEEGGDEGGEADGAGDEENNLVAIGHDEESAPEGDADGGAEELGGEIDAAGLAAFLRGDGPQEGVSGGDEDEGEGAAPHEEGGDNGVVAVEGDGDAEGEDGGGVHAGAVEGGAAGAQAVG